MSKMIQIRNVPNKLHLELKRRAKLRGQSLTEYLEDLLEREVSYPPLEEVIARIESREPVRLSRSVAEMIKEERARRTR
jgi:plasmid stability protein